MQMSMGEPVKSAPSPIAASPPPVVGSTSSIKCIHGVARREGPLNEAVQLVANITLEQANHLIAIGAVWARMEGLSQQDIIDQYYDDLGSRELYADLDDSGSIDVNFNSENSHYNGDNEDDETDLDRYIERMEQQRFRRILTPGRIQAGTDLRVYPRPRRFQDAVAQLDRSRLLYEDTTFLVVDKPPMLPSQPDASNYYECLPGAVQQNLGPFIDIAGNMIARPLLCHRVDACVGGCVVLAKDVNGQKVFHQFQQDRKLRKLYLAVTTAPVPLGIHIHWMWAPQSARGKSGGPPCQLIRHTPPDTRRKARLFWNRCVLEVVKCEPITIPANVRGGYVAPPDEQHYQSTIRLVTGRKHQVRAQLASLNCPIIRDTLYTPMAGRTLDQLEAEEEQDGEIPSLESSIAQCGVPMQPIGLQAHAILFGGIRVKARPPWWVGDR